MALKQIIEDSIIVSVLDKPNKDGKVFPKLVVCDDYGKTHRIGIKPDLVGRFRSMRGQTLSQLVVSVWDRQGPTGNTFQTYDLDSYELKTQARAA